MLGRAGHHREFQAGYCEVSRRLTSRNTALKNKMEPKNEGLKMIFLFKGVTFRFHISFHSFRECMLQRHDIYLLHSLRQMSHLYPP